MISELCKTVLKPSTLHGTKHERRPQLHRCTQCTEPFWERNKLQSCYKFPDAHWCQLLQQLAMWKSLNHWEYSDFLTPLSQTLTMTHHREAWQCSSPLRFLRWMEYRIEVWLITKIRRLVKTVLSTTVTKLFSFMKCPWFMSISAWIVERYLQWMNLQIFTCGLLRRTW